MWNLIPENLQCWPFLHNYTTFATRDLSSLISVFSLLFLAISAGLNIISIAC